jgi:glycosyltransferase involved in cell wall biosynthesis
VAEARVSVLVTAYEHERYIARALDGVLDQRGVAFEVLVGDDASTDGTRDVIERYARAHPGLIRTFLPERNLGHGGSALFAALLERSRGEYVAGLDGDDFWTSPEKLQRQVAYMDAHPGCAMCFHDVLCHHEDGSQPDARFTGFRPAPRVDLGELLDGCQIGSCAPLFRRDAITPLPEWYLGLPWGDAPLYVLAAARGTIDYLPDVMGVYRIHGQGMYRGLPRLRVLELQTGYYERLRVPPEHEAHLRRRLADTWVKLGLEHERLGDRDAARECLAESLRVDPFDPRRLRERRWERRRLALWLLLKAPLPLAHHPRLAEWRRRRVEGRVAPHG